MNVLVGVPFLVPLVGAALAMLVGGSVVAQRVVALVALAASAAAGVALVGATADGDVLAVAAGGHDAPVGVVLVVDGLSAVLLTVAGIVLLAVAWFAVAQRGTDRGWPAFHPTYLVLAAGVALAFTTGDLFTLFVAFELTLIASYVLLTYQGRDEQVHAGMTYTVVNLLGGLLLLTAVALTYAATGTLAFADLAGVWPDLPTGLRSAIGLLLVVAFGIKAAVFPLFMWLPDAYPTAPTPVTAVFAALLTKLGVYAILRVQTVLGLEELTGVLLVAAVATMVVGVLGAVAQDDIKRILSFHSVSQIGYLLFGVALLDVAGITATIVYLAHYIVVKTALFLVVAAIERHRGTASLRHLGGLVTTAPALSGLFLVAALSLAGLPPLSGFVAKLAVVQAGAGAGEWIGVTAALAVGLLTLYSMVKIWLAAFWGAPPAPAVADHHTSAEGTPRVPRGLLLPTAALVTVSLAVAIAAGPLYGLAERAAQNLVDPARYVQEVLG